MPDEVQVPVTVLHGDKDWAPALLGEPRDAADRSWGSRRYRRESRAPAGDSDDEGDSIVAERCGWGKWWCGGNTPPPPPLLFALTATDRKGAV